MIDLVDCHTHSLFSDGASSVMQNVARACELGLSTIACTDHFVLPASMDPGCACSVPKDQVEAYVSEVEQARNRYPGIDVVLGWECDYYLGCEEMIGRYRSGATYLLGSVHALDGQWIDDPDDLAYWNEHDLDDIWTRYFSTWCEACRCSVGFSSMAHPDLVSWRGLRPSDDRLVASLYSQAAHCAREAGVHVEVSAAGLHKPLGSYYPDAELLVEFCRQGVPITVASDAHRLDRIGDHIADLYRYARDAGYACVDVPLSSGGWRSIEL
jgi:histidinol-phosphatase (PHP family)